MPGYQTKQESIAVKGVDDLIIRSLLDKQQFSDPLGEAERLGISSAVWPLFGLLWPSGSHLAARMAVRPVLAGERILEIGCGLGLASLVSHRRGANITASDCHPLAPSFLLENVRLNDLAPMKYRHGQWNPPERVDGEIAIERACVQGQFDLIIGSDVLYERDSKATLAGFIGLHAAPGAEIWIVDPDRGNRAAFSKQMAELGFVVRQERLDEKAADGATLYKGRLLVYQWAASELS